MSKESWLNVEPSSAWGDGTIAVSSVGEHTGRLARTEAFTVRAANCEDAVRTVVQGGKPEFVDIVSQVTVGKDGATVTLTGTSNSKELTFSTGSGELTIVLPDTYLVNGLETKTNEEIAGDPGASAEYDFSITFTIPAITSDTAVSGQVIVTDAAGNTVVATIIQTADDPYLRVEEGDVYLKYLGEEVYVSVESNTYWSVE